MSKKSLIMDHGDHYEMVKDSGRLFWGGDIDFFDFGSNSIPLSRIMEGLDYAIEGEPLAVNISYGGGNTLDCATLADYGYESRFRTLFEMGIPVFVAAGNEGRTYSEGVSVLGGTPFNITVAAVDGDVFAPYSQRSPLLSNVGHNGETPNRIAQGTSFATPRVWGMMSTLLDNGYSLIQAYAALTRIAYIIRGGPTDWYQILNKTIGSPQKVNVDIPWIIAAAYECFLGRQPDLEGWNFWVGEARKHSVELVVRTLVEEGRRQGLYALDRVPVVERLFSHYAIFFNRLPDLEGLAYWLGEITSRKLDYTDGYVRPSDVDWRRVMSAFLDGRQIGDNVRFQDLADIFIATPISASVTSMASCQCVIPKRFEPCCE